MGFFQLSLFKVLFDRKQTEPIRQQQPRLGFYKEHDDQQLNRIWDSLIKTYFPEQIQLRHYKVKWSTRPQKRTLASCSLISKRVRVARELNYPQYTVWLEPLLYHEMCHAVLAQTDNLLQCSPGRRTWHGRDFRALEQKHPLMPAFDQWINSGGWQTAVRSDRAKNAYKRRSARKF